MMFFLNIKFVRNIFITIVIPMRIIKKVRLDNIHLNELIPDPNETNILDIKPEFK